MVQSQHGNNQDPTAFTKGLTLNLHSTIGGEKISFNKRITDIGASFDSEGSFICKTPGIYAFSFYGLTEQNSKLWLEMMKNDHLIASIFAYNVADYADAGNAVIVHLNIGDKVYVKAHNNSVHTLYGRTNQIYNTFTGELLFADNLELDGGPVGFSAVLTMNVTLSGGSVLNYNKVITNIGSGYNSNTGTFTSPIEGTYLFHFHALSYESSEFWLELFHDSHYILGSYGYTGGYYADAGNTAVLHLRKGETVKIKARPGRDARLYGDDDEYYTTFCGALLSPVIYGSGYDLQSEVAFSVGLSHNEHSSSKIVFNVVFLNQQNSYSTNTGIFTAPVAGIYAFHYHALAQRALSEWVELYHNKMYVNSLYAHAAGGYGPGSNSAVLELDVGDTVYLTMQNHGSYLYGGSDNNIYCTFSGYLLSPTALHGAVIG
ncbi:uncharacterized protein LOC134248757 [Saccostrea cucullata]|uniref:uncharacterized protein LOC134248757 n=1 Tax=Saccostrea cuccullata TaxID=36930 RepID=UPI002ED0EA78